MSLGVGESYVSKRSTVQAHKASSFARAPSRSRSAAARSPHPAYADEQGGHDGGIIQPLFGHLSDRRSLAWLMPLGPALGGVGVALAGLAPGACGGAQGGLSFTGAGTEDDASTGPAPTASTDPGTTGGALTHSHTTTSHTHTTAHTHTVPNSPKTTKPGTEIARNAICQGCSVPIIGQATSPAVASER